jgi:Lrp/AsnC family leucine-responsive transcriptional regulator
MSFRELGEAIGLSPTAAAARVDRLIGAGVIEGFAARINRAALGDTLHAYIDIKFTQSSVKDDFLDLIGGLDQIESARHITGPFDCAIDAWVSSSDELAELLIALKSTGNVAEIQTRLVLNSLKD